MIISDPTAGIPESILTTRGDIIYRNATVADRLAKGTAAQILRMGADDPAWSDEIAAAGHINILGHNYLSIGQGTWAYTSGGGTPLFNFWWRNTSENDEDNLSYNVYLAKGTYSLRLLCQTANTHAIVDIDFDDSEIASFDMYSASVVENVVFNQTSIDVAAAGIVAIKLRIDGKHASSGNYKMYMTALALWRTA